MATVVYSIVSAEVYSSVPSVVAQSLTLQNISLIDREVTGTVYQLNIFIAVKRARLKEDKKIDYANKQRKFKFLENYSSISYLIRYYYRTPKNTFLELASNGSIAMLLDQYQQRDRHSI